MGDKQKNPVTIDGVDYVYEDMTQEQQTLVNHCLDLDRKINSASFALDQLKVGKEAFFNMLKTSLDKPAE